MAQPPMMPPSAAGYPGHHPGQPMPMPGQPPCYAAPEMIAGRRYSGAKADIWSLGVCLFAMLCGYLPFEDPDTNNLYKKIMAGTYKVASFVSADARAMIRGLLTTDPNRRFA